MAIDIKVEKELALNSQQIYDIFDFSTQAAYDDGFMNSYIFERALYIFTAIELIEDTDELKSLAAQNINDAWDYMIKENIIDDLQAQYENDCNYIADNGMQWFEDYTAYAHSARGLLDNIQMFAGDIMSNAAQQFKSLNEGSDIQKMLEVADSWGMNNEPQVEDSVFEN